MNGLIFMYVALSTLYKLLWHKNHYGQQKINVIIVTLKQSNFEDLQKNKLNRHNAKKPKNFNYPTNDEKFDFCF